MFAVGDQVLGVQGHPDYTMDILYNLIDRLVSTHVITISTTYIETLERKHGGRRRPASRTGGSGRGCARAS
ncbi:hypothetical protein GUJ93_ZPchr0008g12990 [Zizania palustris]|uniref:Uncharacterized protein n=1 Tax=Zizania palustris TaxID=103762 RepID=A0A8J5RJK9_ZIZPA|nr:hypothetical protein GUJ93_ZPchr0008g12990 [Zizania palustris]